MSIRITAALIAAVILIAPRLAAGTNGGVGENMVAQYCMPEDDVPGAQTIYCRA